MSDEKSGVAWDGMMRMFAIETARFDGRHGVIIHDFRETEELAFKRAAQLSADWPEGTAFRVYALDVPYKNSDRGPARS